MGRVPAEFLGVANLPGPFSAFRNVLSRILSGVMSQPISLLRAGRGSGTECLGTAINMGDSTLDHV